jgi:uncharacterized phage protein (TIGR02218 family)
MAHEIRNYSGVYNSSSLLDHMAESSTTLALFGKITSVPYWGSESIGFTNNTRDVTLSAHDDLVFRSAPGLTPSVVEMMLGTESANMENVLQFDVDGITEPDIEAGKWNYASIELWLMNWNALEMGELVIASHIFGEIHNFGTFFKVETEGKNALLQNQFGNVTQRLCRIAEVGTKTCALNLEGRTSDDFTITKTLTIDSIVDAYHIVLVRDLSENVPDDFYHNGKMTALDGTNAGLSRETKKGTGVDTDYIHVILKRPFPFSLSAGDTVSMLIGDDKTLERCVYLGQGINRQAFDWIQSQEKLNQYPARA